MGTVRGCEIWCNGSTNGKGNSDSKSESKCDVNGKSKGARLKKAAATKTRATAKAKSKRGPSGEGGPQDDDSGRIVSVPPNVARQRRPPKEGGRYEGKSNHEANAKGANREIRVPGKFSGGEAGERCAEMVVKATPSTFAGHRMLCPYDGKGNGEGERLRQLAHLKSGSYEGESEGNDNSEGKSKSPA